MKYEKSFIFWCFFAAIDKINSDLFPNHLFRIYHRSCYVKIGNFLQIVQEILKVFIIFYVVM